MTPPQHVPQHVTTTPQKNLSKKQKKWIKKIINESDVLAQSTQGGHFEILSLLLNLNIPGIDINQVEEKSGATPLRLAVETNHIECVRILLKHPEVNVNQRHPLYGETPLMHCCTAHESERIANIEIIKLLLAHKNIDLDYVDSEPRDCDRSDDTADDNSYLNALMIAADFDFHAAISLLLEAGAQDSLFAAAARGDVTTMKKFLNLKNSNINETNEASVSLLHVACANGKLDAVQFLLSQENLLKNSCNSVDRMAQTPLLATCAAEFEDSPISQMNERVQVVRYLVSRDDVDPNLTDCDGETPFINACREGNLKCIQALIEGCSNHHTININAMNDNRECGLLMAVKANNNVELVKYLLNLPSINVNQCDDDGESPLFVASKRENKEIVDLLLHRGNAKDTLHSAVLRNDMTVLKNLVEVEEVNINQKQGAAGTALHVACLYKKLISVQYLIALPSIQMNVVDKDGRTALFYACEYGYEHIVEALLACKELDVNVKGFNHVLDDLNQTLEETRRALIVEMEGAEMEKKVETEEENKKEKIIKSLKIKIGHLKAEQKKTKESLKRVASSAEDEFIQPLLIAVSNGHLSAVQLLLTRPELDVNVSSVGSKRKEHVLHLVEDDVEMLQALLTRADINVDAKDANNTTPLGVATANKCHEVAKLLMNAGADPSQVWEGRMKIGKLGKTKKKCSPNNHPLIMWKTSNGMFDCQLCDDEQPAGSVLYGCDECEWDMCSACEF